MRVLHAAHVSARLDALITRHHRGDRRAAADRLGMEPGRLAGLLSGDWRHFSLDALATIVANYNVSLNWLLDSSGPSVSPQLPAPPGRRFVTTRAVLADARRRARARRVVE